MNRRNFLKIALAGRKLGYLPRCINKIPARQMDQGRMLAALVKEIDPAAPIGRCWR
jgi:hypothetical protein